MLTCEQRKSFHGRERIVAGRIQYIQPVGLSTDTIDLTMKIFNGRRVLVVKTAAQKATYDRCLTDLGGPEQHHSLTVTLARQIVHGSRDLGHAPFRNTKHCTKYELAGLGDNSRG